MILFYDCLWFSAVDVCASTNAFVKSVATLGNVEENDTLSRALSRLSEVEEKVASLHAEQVGTVYTSIYLIEGFILLLSLLSLFSLSLLPSLSPVVDSEGLVRLWGDN